MRRTRLVLAALLALALGASHADAPSSAPFLWQVTGPSATHYLLGSVHLLPRAVSELPTGIRQAYEAADTLVFESDIDALSSRDSTAAMLDSATAPRGLENEIDAATLARVRTRMVDLKMPAALCERYRPWFCALSLELFAYQRAGFKGEYGLDRRLYDDARRQRRPIVWFETPASHLALFTTMPVPLSREFLDATLSSGQTPDDEPAAMFRAWRDNDVARLASTIADLKRDFPEIHAHLLARRNRAWLPELKRRLSLPQSQLFVVGAAHWIGPDGLIAALESAGYRVRPYLAIAPGQQTRAAPATLLTRD